MSLGAPFFRDRFFFSRKGGTEGSEWEHPKSVDSMAVSGISFRNTLVGSGWATSILLFTNGLSKQSCCLVRHSHLQRGSFYPSLGEWLPAESH